MAKNEVDSMAPIQRQIDNSFMLGQKNYRQDFPFFKSYLLAVFFIPFVLLKYLSCKDPYIKKSYFYAFDSFCLAYALYLTIPPWLKKISPNKVIICNQLNVFHRSLAKYAHEKNIETVFMQHASVSDNFPPLTDYRTAFFEGEDTLHKYQNNESCNLQLYLIGMPKADESFNFINKTNQVKNVGICTNQLDDIKKYENLVKELSNMKRLINIYVRPHPSDRRFSEWSTISKKYDINFSNSKIVHSFDFLKSVDLIIAGDSNIHLEATLMNITSIYYDPLKADLDFYDFKKNGMVEYFDDIKSLSNRVELLISKRESNRIKARYYNDIINTNFDGKSTELAVSILCDQNLDDFFVSQIDKNNNTIHRLKFDSSD